MKFDRNLGGEFTGSEKYIAMVAIGGFMALYCGTQATIRLFFGLMLGETFFPFIITIIFCLVAFLGLFIAIIGARELMKPSDKHHYYPAYMPPPPQYGYYRYPPPPPD
ncbi:MAG: hypothetical protein JSV49_04660 [Thermoplasmata archaeon]|nr:MAG: hypothetical protein JSV49_04660 [Thermoplasmata archaeon]